jgi:putative FmdB family regulatory protein
MPAYDYECNTCGHTFELILKISDHEKPTIEPCPECKTISVKQIITRAIPFGDPVRLGISRLPSDWCEFLRGVKKRNPGSNVNESLH